MRIISFIPALLLCSLCSAQTSSTDNASIEKAAPKELTIPTSPLFDLMGVATSQVARTTNIKDFKVDWNFASWKLSPNIAIQAQPIWEIFYNRKTLDKYQKASGFARMLASMDLSVGTVQTFTNDRRIGGALKINLLRQKDPLLLKGVYDDIQKQYAEELALLKQKEKELLNAIDTLKKSDSIKLKKQELIENDLLLSTYYSRRNAAIQSQANLFTKNNWNSAFIDFAFGKIFTYSTDSAGSLTKLRLNRNTGSGAWLNFGLPLGKKGLLSGLIRQSFYEEEVTFLIKDNASGAEVSQNAVASNNLTSIGLNIRFGGPVHNFFVEFIKETKTIKTALEAVNDVFKTPTGFTIVSSSVKWEIVKPYTINFGGDWRISRNLIINYGIRCILDKDYKTTTFTPIVNIACMMR